MIRVNIVVEGQTEETFVRDVLYDYFVERNIFLNSIVVKTSKKGKGGGSSYGKIRNDVKRMCLHDKTAYVTTMFDYYGLPGNFPGKESLTFNNIYDLINGLENAFSNDINERNFIPNLIVHEFEGLLFSNPDAFSVLVEDIDIIKLKKQLKKFPSPEHVNNSQMTAPSRRILDLFPRYQKTFHGPLISSKIGIDVIRQQCKHFDEWLKKIESLV